MWNRENNKGYLNVELMTMAIIAIILMALFPDFFKSVHDYIFSVFN